MDFYKFIKTFFNLGKLHTFIFECDFVCESFLVLTTQPNYIILLTYTLYSLQTCEHNNIPINISQNENTMRKEQTIILMRSKPQKITSFVH